MDLPGGMPVEGDALIVLDVRLGAPPVQVLALRGSVDARTCDEVTRSVVRARSRSLPVVIDLGGLSFGDETLLGILLDCRDDVTTAFVGPLAASFERRLARTGAVGVLTIHATLGQAISAVNP
ncbi:STAS domain-containing protein [Streptomyces spiramenti]|uniref:STAS domain-containing protein n=1 Tax=Streptomyces spiramenti TaxID=2720606 RepID=A0ABX1AJ37_9ACTN|nr:STAS domain-containing protein [Streptomyces spiramenti]NJP65681.1 STAS domain-containing protein [Streptomyces spiramenti]